MHNCKQLSDCFIVCIRVSTPLPQKYPPPPLFCQAPLKFGNCPRPPLFGQFPPIYWFFRKPPTPLKNRIFQ